MPSPNPHSPNVHLASPLPRLIPEAVAKAQEALATELYSSGIIIANLDPVLAVILAYLTACEAQGIVQVPREPTEAMLTAAEGTGFTGYNGAFHLSPGPVWSAMLVAAPTRSEI